MSGQRKKIAIVLPDLRGGGVERMRINLAKEWISAGFSVDFVLMRVQGELLSILPKEVTVIDLGVDRIKHLFFPLVSYLKKHRPNILLAGMWPLTFIAPLAAKFANKRIRTVVSEHAILSSSFKKQGRVSYFILCITASIGYKLAQVRIAISKGVAADMARLSLLSIKKVHVVYNPAACCSCSPSPLPPPELIGQQGKLILSVGNLIPIKNHVALIEAFSKVSFKEKTILYILGEGPERDRLEKMIKEKKLTRRVFLPGFQNDTCAWYNSADLFVLSSLNEGFGNVLVEALEHGVPIVSTDCPTGPREILSDGHYGKLIPLNDINALANAMHDTLTTPYNSEILRSRGAFFSIKEISKKYLEVILLK